MRATYMMTHKILLLHSLTFNSRSIAVPDKHNKFHIVLTYLLKTMVNSQWVPLLHASFCVPVQPFVFIIDFNKIVFHRIELALFRLLIIYRLEFWLRNLLTTPFLEPIHSFVLLWFDGIRRLRTILIHRQTRLSPQLVYLSGVKSLIIRHTVSLGVFRLIRALIRWSLFFVNVPVTWLVKSCRRHFILKI